MYTSILLICWSSLLLFNKVLVGMSCPQRSKSLDSDQVNLHHGILLRTNKLRHSRTSKIMAFIHVQITMHCACCLYAFYAFYAFYALYAFYAFYALGSLLSPHAHVSESLSLNSTAAAHGHGHGHGHGRGHGHSRLRSRSRSQSRSRSRSRSRDIYFSNIS